MNKKSRPPALGVMESVATFTGLLGFARASSVRDAMDIPLLLWLPGFHGNNTVFA